MTSANKSAATGSIEMEVAQIEPTQVEPEQVELITAEQIAKDEQYLGGYAYQILAKQSQQMAKLRSHVLTDDDTEPLHQMRISTRKLRSAIALFSDVITIGSKSGNTKAIKALKQLTQTLGNVRDLDVMQQWFEQALTDYSKDKSASKNQPKRKTRLHLSKAEKKTINALLKKMKKQRKGAFSQLKKALKGNAYKKLVSNFKHWVKQPNFTAQAQAYAAQSAAQRIIEPVTQLINHDGWLFATQVQKGQPTPIENLTLNQLNEQLADNGKTLHALRKQIKQVRYQSEFFRGLYGITYAAQIKEFREMQTILGKLQDQIVVSEFLATELGNNWAKQLPTLHQTFQNSRLNMWKAWEPYQRKYLKLRNRSTVASQAA